MSDRIKDVIIGIIFLVVGISGFSFLVNVILIDGLKVDKGFLGSVIGALIGAVVLSATTYYIVNEQRKTTVEQIEAQQKVTIKQVEDADKRERERIYLKYLLDEHDRLLKDFWGLEEQVSLFHDATLKYFHIRSLTSQIPPNNPMYAKLLEIELDKAGILTLSRHSIENKSLIIISSLVSFDELLDISKFSELHEVLKSHAERVEEISNENRVTYENLRKKIEEEMQEVKKAYIKVTDTIFVSKIATITRINN